MTKSVTDPDLTSAPRAGQEPGHRDVWPLELFPAGAEALTVATTFDDFPKYFVDAFPKRDNEAVDRLTRAFRLLANSLLVADNIMDQDYGGPLITRAVIRCEALQFEAYREFSELFESGAPFWRRLRHTFAEYAEACLLERQFVEGEIPWAELTSEVALKLAIGKNSLIRVPVLALAELTDSGSSVNALIASLDAYSIALQMHDDVRDWKRDLIKGFPSLLLARTLGDTPDPKRVTNGAYQRDVLREMFRQGHCVDVLRLGLDWLERANEAIRELPRISWEEVLSHEHQQMSKLLMDLEAIVDKSSQRREQTGNGRDGAYPKEAVKP